MLVFVMSNLVCQHRNNLISCHFVHQGVIKNNTLLRSQPTKICIGFGRSFRTINYKDIVEIKVGFSGKFFYFCTKFTFTKRCLFIKQRNDYL